MMTNKTFSTPIQKVLFCPTNGKHNKGCDATSDEDSTNEKEWEYFEKSLKSLQLTSGLATAIANRELIHWWESKPFVQVIRSKACQKKIQNSSSDKAEIGFVTTRRLEVIDGSFNLIQCVINIALHPELEADSFSIGSFDMIRPGMILQLKAATPLYFIEEDDVDSDTDEDSLYVDPPTKCRVVLVISEFIEVGTADIKPSVLTHGASPVFAKVFQRPPLERGCSPPPSCFCKGELCSLNSLNFQNCVLSDFPVHGLDLHAIAETFPFTTLPVDDMEPRHKRNLAYYWYATQVYGVFGLHNRFALPMCVKEGVRYTWPNKHGLPYSDDIGTKAMDNCKNDNAIKKNDRTAKRARKAEPVNPANEEDMYRTPPK